MSDNPFEDPYENNEVPTFQPAESFGRNYQPPSTNSIQPAAIIQPTVSFDFESSQTDSTPAFSTPNQPLIEPSAPTNATLDNNSFNQNQPQKEYHFWNIEYYSFLFNVDTKEVVHRIGRSMVPYPPTFFEIIQRNPDLYGPFWIASTVIFLLAATSNVGKYFTKGSTINSRYLIIIVIQNNEDLWKYDVDKLSYAAIAIYGYLSAMPLILFAICKWWKIKVRLTEFFCLYGYSFFIYIPISIICIFPSTTLRWVVVSIGGTLSTLFLILNTKALIAEHVAKGATLLIVMAVLHLGFALSCQLYFFAIFD